MGEPPDISSVDRIHSWAKAHASGHPTSPTSTPQRPAPAQRSHSSNTAPNSAVHDAASSSTTRSPGSSASNNRPFNEKPAHGAATGNAVADTASAVHPPATSPADHTQAAGSGDAAIEKGEGGAKPPISTRIFDGMKRFALHTKDAIFHSKINVLLVFVPIGIAVNFTDLDASIVFAMNAVAIIPLAGMLSHATETVASRLGDSLGALLNVTFGNAVELIIFIIALAKDEINIVQASLIGSILSNLLLILGMAFLLGGLRYREQIYNSTITQMSACLLSLSVMSLLLPTAFHASFKQMNDADRSTLKVSRGTSVILLFVYFLYLLFQLKSHAHLYQSMPQHMIDEESYPGVLANIMDTSSSSSGSDTSSSSSDTDSSSGSHHTAKRIRKAFKNRRRRKSSASSKDASVPSSLMSSPMTEQGGPQWGDNASVNTGTTSRDPKRRRGSVLNAIVSGDEADTEDARVRHMPRVRDFEGDAAEGSKSPERKHKKKTKQKRSKHHRRHGKGDPEKTGPTADGELAVPGDGNRSVAVASAASGDLHSVHVDFAEPAPAESVPAPDESAARRGFRPSLLRPPLPSLLSNNVFVTPLNGDQSGANQTGSSATRPNLRRATSLPGRLNEGAEMAPTASLPPYSRGYSEAKPPVGQNDEDAEPPVMSRTAAVVTLLLSTGLVALCAEFLVDAIPEMVESSGVSEAFIGLIVLPIVGNAAEHVTAVAVAAKNKMDLAIGVAVGSSIQIALFVTPLVVILGWIMDKEMTLYFTLFETISLFVTAFVVNFLVLDGRSNYLEGALLCSSYLIIAVAAFFYPDQAGQSELGGSMSSE